MSVGEPTSGAVRQSREPFRASRYESGLFAELTGLVSRLGGDVDVLDLGPTIPANLMFWIRRGHRVTARDYTDRGRADDAALALGPDQRFGAIVAWNVFSFLPRSDSRALMAELEGYLMPGGALFAIFDGDGRRAPIPVRYRILGEGRLQYEAGDPTRASRAVTTSEVEGLMSNLSSRISVMRHGSREALARRPREDSP